MIVYASSYNPISIELFVLFVDHISCVRAIIPDLIIQYYDWILLIELIGKGSAIERACTRSYISFGTNVDECTDRMFFPTISWLSDLSTEPSPNSTIKLDQVRSIYDHHEASPNHLRSSRSNSGRGYFVEGRKKFLTCQKLFSTLYEVSEHGDHQGSSRIQCPISPNCSPITKMDRPKGQKSGSWGDRGVRSRMCERGIRACFFSF